MKTNRLYVDVVRVFRFARGGGGRREKLFGRYEGVPIGRDSGGEAAASYRCSDRRSPWFSAVRPG
jgi:hypothetical protein